MAITATKKFNWTNGDGQTEIYFPGMVITDQDAAAFAEMQGYGEERGMETPARTIPIHPPENKAADLQRQGGESKKEKKKRAKNQDDEMVLGSEDEIPQD